MTKRTLKIIFALFLIVWGTSLFKAGIASAQDEPVRNVLTLTVGCPEDFNGFVAVPVGYSATYRVDALASSTDAVDTTQFIGYAPDGGMRTMFAGTYDSYFYVLFTADGLPLPNFGWHNNVSWSINFYDYQELQTISINVDRNGNPNCSPPTEATPSPEPLPPDYPIVTVEGPDVAPFIAVGKTCTVSYPSLVVVCQ